MSAPPATFIVPADSGRAIADVYSVSLVATVPILAAVLACLCLQFSSAGTRAIVWRCGVTGILAIYAGRFVPWEWMAWVLPEPLARPLVALGTVRLDTAPGLPGSTGGSVPGWSLAHGLLVLYWGGVVLVLVRMLVARARLRVAWRHAIALSAPSWTQRIRLAASTMGVAPDKVHLRVSPQVPVPITWGIRRHVVLLPQMALRWPADRVQAVLRHELAHVRARDAAMRLMARIACALFWFHPGVWWLAGRLERDSEAACDDRVLLSGIRASDYAEWLATSTPADSHLDVAMAFARRSNLRRRLATVIDTHRRVALPDRRVSVAMVALTVALVAPLATARVAPTRRVLTSLMLEARWESRAWAVVRLAQRADSVDVARSAARHDPDPAVRAWARYALGLN